MGGGRERRRGTALLIAVCAVLFGLFLMHGAPATAAGCHGEATAAAGAMAHDGHAPAPVQAHPLAAAPHHPGAGVLATERGTDAHGLLCVSISAGDRLPLPASPLVAIVLLALLAAWAPYRTWRLGRTARRGPPGGRPLLLKVCIART